MSPGHFLSSIADMIRAAGDHRKPEDILMSALTHLSAAVDKLVADNHDKDMQIAQLQSQISAQQPAAGGATDDELNAETAKIEAVTGAVTDPTP